MTEAVTSVAGKEKGCVRDGSCGYGGDRAGAASEMEYARWERTR